ncbi:MAG TPA: iron-sulfur cluster assembly accessory protein [Gemmatimonadales bacterium]|nr:iron-sulfur cluster assembly accessory protein [Gemmatimonadales bacterium]
MTTTQQMPVTVTLTDRAADEVRKFMAEEKVPAETAGLRIGVMPGGCSGFKYSLNIEERAAADDITIESAGVRLFVDTFSAQYLNGVTLDYKSNFQESGFAFENPNATGGCGCGSSFTV